MDDRSLSLFVHLSRTLHFGRTARECHVSPSALSRTVQRLEDELGVALFVRDRRRVELTADGRRFGAFAADLLDRWERFRRETGGALEGTLSVFCTVTAAQTLLPAMLGRFRERHPDVQIRVETGYAGDALGMLSSGVDVTVAALPAKLPSSVVAHTLTVTPLVFVARVGAKRPARLDDVPMIVPPSGLARDAVDRWFREQGAPPELYSETPSHEAILSLVAMGCGVGVVPRLVVESSALRDELRVLDVRPRLADFRVGACVRRARLRDPLVSAFWQTVAGYAP